MKTMLLVLCLFFSSVTVAEVFKCKQAGRTIYSQNPCGDNSLVVADRVSVGGHVELPEPVSLPLAATPQPRPVPQQPARVVQVPPPDCKLVEQSLANIRSRMRAGYTAAESNFLNDQERIAMKSLDACRASIKGFD